LKFVPPFRSSLVMIAMRPRLRLNARGAGITHPLGPNVAVGQLLGTESLDMGQDRIAEALGISSEPFRRIAAGVGGEKTGDNDMNHSYTRWTNGACAESPVRPAPRGDRVEPGCPVGRPIGCLGAARRTSRARRECQPAEVVKDVSGLLCLK
jgi:hypothetical protein